MWRLLVLAAAFAAVPVSSAPAQDTAAQFYKGRQVTVIVGSSAGGGYDIYARLVARHMGKYIPGNPTLVVSNMPGAGQQRRRRARLQRRAQGRHRDRRAAEQRHHGRAVRHAARQRRRLRHDATKLIHIGSATTDHYVCIARADAPVKSVQGALTRS